MKPHLWLQLRDEKDVVARVQEKLSSATWEDIEFDVLVTLSGGSYSALEQLAEGLASAVKPNALVKITASGNDVGRLPNNLCRVLNLTCLKVSRNKLTSLPNDLPLLRQLTFLDLEQNDLVEFPEVLCQVQSLQELYVGHNKLSRLPKTLTNLQHLVCLGVACNQLTCIPSFLGRLPQLQSLWAGRNPLVEQQILLVDGDDDGCSLLSSPLLLNFLQATAALELSLLSGLSTPHSNKATSYWSSFLFHQLGTPQLITIIWEFAFQQ